MSDFCLLLLFLFLLQILLIFSYLYIFVTAKRSRIMDIGKVLKVFREKNNFSQEAVASFLGIKRELLSYYENDSREASVEVLEKLADLYGTHLSEFFETDIDHIHTNVAFAFRASDVNESDMKELAQFRKVVKNYLKLVELEKEYAK